MDSNASRWTLHIFTSIVSQASSSGLLHYLSLLLP